MLFSQQDDLPLRGFIGHLEEGGFLPHTHKVFLWKHLNFNIQYNQDQVSVAVTDSHRWWYKLISIAAFVLAVCVRNTLENTKVSYKYVWQAWKCVLLVNMNVTKMYCKLCFAECMSFCFQSWNNQNEKFAQKTWTLFCNNVNTAIRKYSSRAFIWVVTPLGLLDSSGFRGFLGLVKWTCGSEMLHNTLLQVIAANVSTTNHQPVSLDEVQSFPLEIMFTYSVVWHSTK